VGGERGVGGGGVPGGDGREGVQQGEERGKRDHGGAGLRDAGERGGVRNEGGVPGRSVARAEQERSEDERGEDQGRKRVCETKGTGREDEDGEETGGEEDVGGMDSGGSAGGNEGTPAAKEENGYDIEGKAQFRSLPRRRKGL